jgi:chromosomal replication initiation ATPase DnaA
VGEQPRLFAFSMGERSPDTLVVSQANRNAATLLRDWRNWPGGALALIGPRGAGKTHLALAWALETGARQLEPLTPSEAAAARFHQSQGRLLIEGGEGGCDERMLWRVLDLARSGSGAVLLTGVAPPVNWPVTLPDLRSRLAALPVAQLEQPDEALMEVLVRRICREQFIHLRDDAARYLARELPRSFEAVRMWAACLDADLSQAAKPVSLSRAKRALRAMLTRRGGGDS